MTDAEQTSAAVPTGLSPEAERRFTSAIFGASALCTSYHFAYRALQGRVWHAGLFVALVALAVGCGPLIAWWQRRGYKVALFLTVAVLNLAFVVPELALRRANKYYYRAAVQFAYPTPEAFAFFDLDPDLFWRFRAGADGVNSLGMAGGEIAVPKPADVFRILFLGDSCTYLGYIPGKVEERLNRRPPPGKRVECVALAVPGYSSHQGRILAQRYGRVFEPDLAVVYFGWNDHWRAYGAVDAEKKVYMPTTWSERFRDWAFQHSRLLNFFRQSVRERVGADSSLRQLRVPPKTYRENLTEIQRTFTSQGLPVVMITAATSYYRLGIPAFSDIEDRTLSQETAIRDHRWYNEIVRQLAREHDLLLLDLAKAYSALSVAELDETFTLDGIHFSDRGQQRLADEIERVIREQVFEAEKSRP
ncbi:SGNH/GDSL hydrolase family protein [Candidatus Sumerlaeota bacterium]